MVNSNNHSLQPSYAENHLWTHNTLNPEADGQQQQKTTPGAAPVSLEQETEDTITQAQQNWTIEDCKNVAWSDESRFLLRHSDVESEFGVKNMKAWIHPALSRWFRLVVVEWCRG